MPTQTLKNKPATASRASTRFVAAILFSSLLVLSLSFWIYWQQRKSSLHPPRLSIQQTEHLDAWTVIGGTWKIADHVIYSNHVDQRGVKLVTGSSEWANYTLTADMQFIGDRGDMGVIIRSNDEEEGLDAYNGYYVALRIDGGSLIIGRSNYGWVEARPAPLPGGVHSSTWYRLRVTAYGCNIAASVQNLTTRQTAWIAFKERSCVKTGRVGLRAVDIDGMWRNVSVQQARWADYLELSSHAASVEQPVVLTGPPWWTPWHVAMLFAAALAFALLIQLVYFRILRWKTYTIMQERERLAHEIHDTMAQSFAGVGYQIQGIRSSVVRSNHQDSRYIADQLSVAYQLIRRCHSEASGTIAMLALSSPDDRQDLLQVLASTANKIAGNKIKTTTVLHGNIAPLSLSLTDALLHIGQEAIANAVSHAAPTTLTLTLRYEESNVELSIQDDGHGFDLTPQTMGFGLLGMQKRARNVAATLNITTLPGAGTTVAVRAKRPKDKLLKRIMLKLKTGFQDIPE
jgi:signal transduction histidine kinase